MATMTRKPTKAEVRKARIEEIRSTIETDRYAVLKAIHVIHQRQTADEQRSGFTTHENGMGWTGADAEFMTSLHDQMERNIAALRVRVRRTPKRWEVAEVALSEGQVRAARRALRKYAGQLLEASTERSVTRTSTDTLVDLFAADLATTPDLADAPPERPRAVPIRPEEPEQRSCGGCIECDGEDACTHRGSCGHWTQGPADEPCLECSAEAGAYAPRWERDAEIEREIARLRPHYPGAPDEELEMMVLEAMGDRAQTLRDDEARWGREVG